MFVICKCKSKCKSNEAPNTIQDAREEVCIPTRGNSSRSSLSEVFSGKLVLKINSIFIGKDLC